MLLIVQGSIRQMPGKFEFQDSQDLQPFMEQFSSHPPFPDFHDIISFSKGLTGDAEINPHKAYDVGVNQTLLPTTLQKSGLKEKMGQTPGAAMKEVRIRNVTCTVDPERGRTHY